MRIVIDIMIGLMLVAVVAGGLYLYNSREQGKREVESVRVALQQLQEQTAYHRAVQSAMAGRDVLLVHLHADWFGEDLPANVLLDGERPWIDLAPPGDLGKHPPDPVVYNNEQASFWYNPTTGLFRARVSPASSEALTLALYNEINGTALSAFEQIPDPTRQPLAHVPGKTPVKQYASMANKTWSEVSAEDDTLKTDLLTTGPDTYSGSPGDAPAKQVNLNAGVNAQAEDDFVDSWDKAPTSGEALSETGKRPTLEKD